MEKNFSFRSPQIQRIPFLQMLLSGLHVNLNSFILVLKCLCQAVCTHIFKSCQIKRWQRVPPILECIILPKLFRLAVHPVGYLRAARAFYSVAAARGPGFLLLARRWLSGLPATALQLLSVVPAAASLAGRRRRLRHDPRVPLALEGPSRPRRRDPERRLLGEVAEQEPLPRHAERERLSRTPLGHGPGTRVARAAGGGRRAAQSSAVPRADETLWGSHRAAPEFRTCAVMRAHLRPSSTAAGWWRLAVRVPERPCGRKCAL